MEREIDQIPVATIVGEGWSSDPILGNYASGSGIPLRTLNNHALGLMSTLKPRGKTAEAESCQAQFA